VDPIHKIIVSKESHLYDLVRKHVTEIMGKDSIKEHHDQRYEEESSSPEKGGRLVGSEEDADLKKDISETRHRHDYHCFISKINP
jgi:hypothetical protein